MLGADGKQTDWGMWVQVWLLHIIFERRRRRIGQRIDGRGYIFCNDC
jgi:hypothetical protein